MGALVFTAPPVPLRTDADQVIRVGQTRVTLDTVVSAFRNGATAEQIAHDYPVLALVDIYAVIAFYLRQQDTVDAYLAERRAQSEELREQLQQRYDARGIRERLLARRDPAS
jgi:uncharacterized protein (DUF433 family)